MSRSVRSNVEIEAPIETVYGYWEALENLPEFMRDVKEVRRTQSDNMLWRVEGAFGSTLEWETRTVLKEPYRRIEWVPARGSAGISGAVRFEETGPGKTRIEARLDYVDPSAGSTRRRFFRSLNKPHLPLDRDLRSLKAHLEGRAAPEEVRGRSAAVGLQRSRRALNFAIPGALLLATGVLIYLLRKRRRSRASAARTLKLDRYFWKDRAFWDLVVEALITSR